MENKNLYGLDLLRGMAGYGVAITHYLYFKTKTLNQLIIFSKIKKLYSV